MAVIAAIAVVIYIFIAGILYEIYSPLGQEEDEKIFIVCCALCWLFCIILFIGYEVMRFPFWIGTRLAARLGVTRPQRDRSITP